MVLNPGTILILGSEGFIGSHLVRYFTKSGYTVFGCDLTEYPSARYDYFKLSILSPDFETIFDGQNFSFCINASGSGNVGFSMEHPIVDFESNTSSVIKVLDSLRKFQPQCKYIQMSSAAVYGNPRQLPVREDVPADPYSPYGWHKYMSELLCKEYFRLYQVKNVILRPFSVYGNGLKKQLLWDLCVRLSENKVVELFGTGEESRDFIHVDDLVLAIDTVMQNGNFESEIYNIATGQETTIMDIASIFEKKLEGKCKILFSGKARSGDPYNWCASIDKIKDAGFKPSVKLEDGIASYIQWFRSFQKE